MKRILIIEDEPDVAQSIKMYLESEGYAAEYSLDAAEGIKMIVQFDLVLLDLIMPKLSGEDVLRQMRMKKITKPVIVLSAVGMPATVGKGLAKEFPGLHLIPKTALHTKLLPIIKKLLKT
jgi:DNA-binding response OmpR family regulator